MQPIFTTSQVAGRQVTDLYFEKLRDLQIPYEFQTVETSFGDTNVIVTGEVRKPPLVLVHGYYSCAPVAIEALQPLQAHFRIFAIDIPGQPNLSAAFRPAAHGTAYGQWLYEIVSRLQLSHAILVGISLGGYIAVKALACNSRKIAMAFLIAPAGLVSAAPFKYCLAIHRHLHRFGLFKKKAWAERLAGRLVTDKSDFAFRFLTTALTTCPGSSLRTPRLRRSETASIKTPLYLVAAEKDTLYPGKRLLHRARRLFPGLVHARLLEGSKHVPSQRDWQQVAAWILQAVQETLPNCTKANSAD